MSRATPVAALLLALAAGPATAEQYACRAGGLSLSVDVDPPAGTCIVDGQRVSLRRAHDPVVCHIADPQLRILTITTDGAFTWEDTASARVLRGTCEGA
jgi:hypothetical protein